MTRGGLRASPFRAPTTFCAMSRPKQFEHFRYVGDKRDPVIIDNVLHTMQFSALGEAGATTPIATLVNWAAHPESIGDQLQHADRRLVQATFDLAEVRIGERR